MNPTAKTVAISVVATIAVIAILKRAPLPAVVKSLVA